MRGRLKSAAPYAGFDTRVAIGASVLVAAAIGAILPGSPIGTAVLVVCVALLGVLARFGVFGIAAILTATLPWLLAMSELLPRLTVTFAAGATAVLLALVAMPRSDGSRAALLLRGGIVLFFAPVLLSLARVSFGAAFIQAAKLVVFPLMVLVIAEATNRRDLVRLRTVAYWSTAAAITVNLCIGFSGVANTQYYETGEILGYGNAHALALLSGCLFAAALASRLSVASASVAAIAAIAAVATGVRSALPGLVLVAVARMITGQVRLRVVVLVALVVVGVFASGAADVVEARFRQSEARGEFQSLSSVGSGRGAIYTTALEEWWKSSPVQWVTGTGLRSIGELGRDRLGAAFGGHSDVIDVAVQLGIVGLIGLLLMWRVLIERADSRLPLLVLGTFALVDGLLEYSAAVVIGVLFTVGLTARDGMSRRLTRTLD